MKRNDRASLSSSTPGASDSRNGLASPFRGRVRSRGRELLRSLFLFPRLPAGHLRLCALPSFVVIGAQKAGTTSLFRYLAGHPAVIPPRLKEIHFFDLHWARGLPWYRAHFPLTIFGGAPLTGEASPYYLFHPRVPERMARVLPDARILVLLRNPVDRAISHYHWEVRYGNERLSFRDAIEREERFLQRETDRLCEEDGYNSFLHQHGSYLARGRYAEQLQRWLHHFRRDQILVLKAEDFFRRTREVMVTVRAFLELPEGGPEAYPIHGRGRSSGGRNVDRKELTRYFRPHNEALEGLLGMNLSEWG